MTPMNFRDTQGILVVCDLTNKSSLYGLEDWINMIKDHAPENVAVCIAGNKSDLEDYIDVTEEELKAVADKSGYNYILTSAYQNKGIEEAFTSIVKDCKKRNLYLEPQVPSKGSPAKPPSLQQGRKLNVRSSVIRPEQQVSKREKCKC